MHDERDDGAEAGHYDADRGVECDVLVRCDYDAALSIQHFTLIKQSI